MYNQKKRETLSVIIPVHNAEKFLSECVQSILNQINETDEIILVENGSDDDSLEICRKYSEKFNNIKTFVLGKVGVSVARNEGVKLARNGWIIFVDADDKLLDGALNCIRDQDLPPDAEIIVGGYGRNEQEKSCFNGKYTVINPKLLARGVLRFSKYKKRIQALAPIDDYNNWTCWGKFYKRQFLIEHDIQFPEGIQLSEDTAFCFQAYCAAQHVYGINDILYYYGPNEQSTIYGYKRLLVENNEKLLAKFENYREIYCLDNREWGRDIASFYVVKLIDICRCMQDKRYRDSSSDKLKHFRKLYETSHIKRAIKVAPFLHLVNGKKNELIYIKYLIFIKLGWLRPLFK